MDRYTLKKTTTPLFPVSVSEARDYVVDSDSRRGPMLDRMIGAATLWLETRTERQFMPATWKLYRDLWPGDCRKDPRRTYRYRADECELWPCPVNAVSSVQYYDVDGTLQTVDSSLYHVDVDSEPGLIVPVDGSYWPDLQAGRPNAVIVTFDAGYSATDDTENEMRKAVPDLAKQLILMHVGAAYEGADGRPSEAFLQALEHDVWPLCWTQR